MLLPGNVHSAPFETVGFDSDTVITFSPAQRFAQQDVRSCLHYLSLTAREASADIHFPIQGNPSLAFVVRIIHRPTKHSQHPKEKKGAHP
jgi:hypothetical protein